MQIMHAEEIQPTPVRALIYGAPGAGKTTMVKYLPGKTLLFDADRTSGVLRGAPGIDIVCVDTRNTFQSWSDLLMELMNKDGMGYDNIVIDNISELERMILSSLGAAGKNNGIPCQADYQFMQYKLTNSLRYMRSLDKNIIWTAWEIVEPVTDGEGNMTTVTGPQISQKIRNNICGLCNIVGRMVAKADGTRGIVMQSMPGVYAKNQFDGRAGCLQSELLPNGEAANKAQAEAAQEAAKQEAAQAGQPLEYICEQCGCVIVKDGTGRTPEQIASGTRNFTGHEFCIDCFRAWNKLNSERLATLEQDHQMTGMSEEDFKTAMQVMMDNGVVTDLRPGNWTEEQYRRMRGW
jgi:phage nucleotide-binding protein